MLSLILVALAAPAAAHAPPLPALRCEQRSITYVGKAKGTGSFQRLGELPPARHYLAVVREVGGCPAPAVVRSGIGAGGR